MKKYAECEHVKVFDEGRKKWLKAITLSCVRYDENDPSQESWECQLCNAGRGIGSYDTAHMKKEDV